jgi:hypothetical protein
VLLAVFTGASPTRGTGLYRRAVPSRQAIAPAIAPERGNPMNTNDQVILTHHNRAKHGVSIVRLDQYTSDDLDFQVIAPERRDDQIATGKWYNVGAFRADEGMIGRVHRNIEFVTELIVFMASIAWTLYEAGRLYDDPSSERE